jgi:hypothetical protein
MNWLSKYKNGGPGDDVLQNIYAKWPALKKLGKVTIKPDESFTRDKTGVGDIEFFGPNTPQVTYNNGYVAQNPGVGGYGILYNPNTNDEQSIRLDMLHGMSEADPKFRRLRNRFERAVKNSDIYNEMNHWYNIDKEKGNAEDGKEKWIDNYTDGQLRTLLYEGDRSKQNYSDEEASELLSNPRIKRKFNKLNNYLQRGEYGGDISIPNVYPNQMISKYGPGGETTDGCPPWHVKVNGECVSIYSDQYKKLYAQGLTPFITNTGNNDYTYVTPDVMKGINESEVVIHSKLTPEQSRLYRLKNKKARPSDCPEGYYYDMNGGCIKKEDYEKWVQQKNAEEWKRNHPNEASFSADNSTESEKQQSRERARVANIQYAQQNGIPVNWETGELDLDYVRNKDKKLINRPSSGYQFIQTPEIINTLGAIAPGGEDVGRVQAPWLAANAVGVAAAPVVGAVAPYVAPALNAPIYAGAPSALTTGNLLNLGFGAYSANQFVDPNSATRESLRTAYNNPTFGNVTDATANTLFNTLGVAFSPGLGTATKAGVNQLGALKNNVLGVNLEKQLANNNLFARQIYGNEAYQSFLKQGPTTRPDVPRVQQLIGFAKTKPSEFKFASGESMSVIPSRQDGQFLYPYFSEGKLWYTPQASKINAGAMGKERVIVADPTKFSQGTFARGTESNVIMSEPSADMLRKVGENRRIMLPYEGVDNPANFQLYERNWLGRYKTLKVPQATSATELSSFNNASGIASGNVVNEATSSAATAPIKSAESFQMQELPGLHIKSTMTGSPLEKQLSKTGEIDVNNINAYIGKIDVPQQDKYIIEKVLNEKFAGKKKINYNEFRQAVQNELVPLEREVVPDYQYSNFGLGNLGFTAPKAKNVNTAIFQGQENIRYNTETIAKIDDKLNKASELGLSEEQITKLQQNKQNLLNDIKEAEVKLGENKKLLENLPLENETLMFKNTENFGKGNTKHFDDPATLGHTRIYVSADDPNTMHVLESQSDFYQMEGSSAFKRYSGEGAEEKISSVLEKRLESLEDNKKALADLEYRFKNNIPDDTGFPVQQFQVDQFKGIVNDKERQILLSKGELKNWKQKMYLGKGHQERLLQENIKYAVEKGMTKMRYPTRETAYKVQDYKTLENVNREGMTVEELENLDKQLKAQETILKKYEDAPKMIKKTLGVEVKTVTDGKGNTWYEFDIPESFRTGKGEIRAFADGGWVEKYKQGGGLDFKYKFEKGGNTNWLSKYK